MIKEPKISVLMSVYNAERYVSKAIESILQQTFKDFEFIIINDGSEDNSSEIIRSYDDDRIIRIEQQNCGLIFSLNKGIEKSRSPLIARMDADDISLPARLKIQFSWMSKIPEVGIAGVKCRYIDTNEVVFADSSDTLMEHQDILEGILHAHRGTSLIHPTVMMRKQVVLRAGGYNDRFPVCEDIDLWLRVSRFSKLHVINETQYLYRCHDKNVSITARSTQLLSGILARVCYYLRQYGMPDPSCNTREEWAEFYDFARNIVDQREIYQLDKARAYLSGELSKSNKFVKIVKLALLIASQPKLGKAFFFKRKWNNVIDEIYGCKIANA